MMRGIFPRLPALGGFLSRPRANRDLLLILFLGLGVLLFPMLAVADEVPAASTGTFGDNFPQFLAQHQDDLAPFFQKNADDFFKLAVPTIMGLMGWLVIFTMLLGWVIDVGLSRGFAYFFAPAYAEWKRCVIYATGRIFLSFIYTGMMALTIILCLGFAHAGVIIMSVLLLLMIVALAAQVVWILYLYRTDFMLSLVFYFAVLIVHAVAGSLLAGPFLQTRVPGAVIGYIDGAITPRLRAEADATRQDLVKAKADRDTVQSKTSELSNQIAQGQAEKERLRQEIEDKKNSDIYVFAQIIKVRANGDLTSARDQLAAFPSKFPGSLLGDQVRTQLSEVNNQIAAQTMEQKQQLAEAAHDAAVARSNLLERAAKGEVTLSEMRQTLLNKSRDQVKDLLGPPSETGPDSWGYRQQMIVNPQTNEKFGLMVYFSEGLVQSVDYNRNLGGITQ